MKLRTLPIYDHQKRELVPNAGQLAHLTMLFPEDPRMVQQILNIREDEFVGLDDYLAQHEYDVDRDHSELTRASATKVRLAEKDAFVAGFSYHVMLRLSQRTGKLQVNQSRFLAARILRERKIDTAAHQTITTKIKKALRSHRNSAHLCASWLTLDQSEKSAVISGLRILSFLNKSETYLREMAQLIQSANTRDTNQPLNAWRVPEEISGNHADCEFIQISEEEYSYLEDYDAGKS